MVEFQYTIQDADGIHARPAGRLAKLAKGYASDVTLHVGEKSCSAKKLMALMGLGVQQHNTVTVQVQGDDEAACAQELKQFFQDNL